LIVRHRLETVGRRVERPVAVGQSLQQPVDRQEAAFWRIEAKQSSKLSPKLDSTRTL
jgi:hypothetical protein